MPVKTYLSDLYAPVKMEWQEAILAPVVPGWPSDAAIFRDVLGRHERRKHSAELLIKRSEMLRPTARGETDTIYIASLTVLAWDENDFRATVADIIARGSAIIAVDDGLTIDRDADLQRVIVAWRQARKRKRLAGVQIKGGRISAELKKAESIKGVEKIRRYWGMPSDEWPTLKLRQMAGSVQHPMAYNTIVAHIGHGREIAQKRYLAALRRKVTMAEKEMA